MIEYTYTFTDGKKYTTGSIDELVYWMWENSRMDIDEKDIVSYMAKVSKRSFLQKSCNIRIDTYRNFINDLVKNNFISRSKKETSIGDLDLFVAYWSKFNVTFNRREEDGKINLFYNSYCEDEDEDEKSKIWEIKLFYGLNIDAYFTTDGKAVSVKIESNG